MKEVFIWIMLYAVYWYISAILGNALWNFTKIDWINDAARLFFPFIFLGITYVILKLKKKNTSEENKKTVKISENKVIINILKIIGIFLGIFFGAVFLVMMYAHILLIIG